MFKRTRIQSTPQNILNYNDKRRQGKRRKGGKTGKCQKIDINGNKGKERAKRKGN